MLPGENNIQSILTDIYQYTCKHMSHQINLSCIFSTHKLISYLENLQKEDKITLGKLLCKQMNTIKNHDPHELQIA